jgi:hypothetical protein
MIEQDNFSCTIFDFKIIFETGQIGKQKTLTKIETLILTKPQNNYYFK